jgi:hypothetical protein
MSGFWFLATPYRTFPGGLDAAFDAAAEQLAVLANADIPTYSLVTQMHPAIVHGAPSPLDGGFWERFSAPVIRHAEGLIVCELPGYEKSTGIQGEIEAFEALGKPVVRMQPGTAPALAQRRDIPGR